MVPFCGLNKAKKQNDQHISLYLSIHMFNGDYNMKLETVLHLSYRGCQRLGKSLLRLPVRHDTGKCSSLLVYKMKKSIIIVLPNSEKFYRH
jgi:hypothetical protein